jgi:E3 ubiquitin-protein ligase BRE1
MQEYSRKAATAESRLEELHKRCVHHDDHLRIIDAWWRQVSTAVDSHRAIQN